MQMNFSYSHFVNSIASIDFTLTDTFRSVEDASLFLRLGRNKEKGRREPIESELASEHQTYNPTKHQTFELTERDLRTADLMSCNLYLNPQFSSENKTQTHAKNVILCACMLFGILHWPSH